MRKQRGLSVWGFVWVAALVICVAILAVRSVPPYLNNQKINNALNLLLEESDVMTASRISLLRKMKRRLNIDYADTYVDLDKAFTVKSIKGGRQMTVNYEVLVPVAYNAYLLFDFKNEVLATKNPNG
ncbi:MAG: DUF4845 domain-containing protein [Gammaproteobacteria bacterium]|jgi:hypothetical protein